MTGKAQEISFMDANFPHRPLTAIECAKYRLTPTTPMGSAMKMQPSDLQQRYRWSADKGDNPKYRGLLDGIGLGVGVEQAHGG